MGKTHHEQSSSPAPPLTDMHKPPMSLLKSFHKRFSKDCH